MDKIDEICRLCLTITNKSLRDLKEGVISKLRLLSINIMENSKLPKKICTSCFNIIKQLSEFQENVSRNESKLHRLLHDQERLNKFYTSLLGNMIVKTEANFDEENYTDASVIQDQPNLPAEDFLVHHNSSNLVDASKNNKRNFEIQNPLTDEVLEKTQGSEERCCLTCSVYFQSQIELIQHYEASHRYGDSENFENIDEKYSKVNCTENETKYECHCCGQVYDDKEKAEKHIKERSIERPFVCKLCGRTYKTVYEIIRHGRVHSNYRLFCSKGCGYNTVYRGALKDHENRHAEPKYKFTCDKCGKGFNTRTWFDQHQNLHNNLKPFACDLCGMAFHMHRYLTAHRSTVHPQCSSVKRYKCPQCQLPCDTKNSLTLHMDAEHGVSSRLLCDICGKVCRSGEQLKHHKNAHLGVKPHECSVCHKRFAKKFNLNLHARTHSGERAHACGECGRTFTQRSTLVRHHRRHHSGS